MSTGESSVETVPAEDRNVDLVQEEVPKAEATPPLTEEIRELWKTISVPFRTCRLVQQISLLAIVLCYLLYVLISAGWPRDDYTLISSYCDPEHPQWTEDITYRKQEPVGTYWKGGVEFKPGAYWTYQNYKRGCPCKVKTCVRKCCPKHERYQSKYDLTCTPDFDSMEPSIFNDLTNNVYTNKDLSGLERENFTVTQVDKEQFKVVSGYADCGKYIGMFGAFYEVLSSSATLLEDGTALTKDGLLLDIDDYCMDHTREEGEVITVRCVKVKVLHQPDFWTVNFRTTGEWVAIALSYVGFLGIIVVSMFVRELRNVHATLLIGFTILLCINFSQYLFDFLQPWSSLAYLWQFCLLAIFSWMTTFGVQVWLCSCGDGGTEWWTGKNLALYGMYAIGLPGLLTGLTWGVGVVPVLSDSCPRPRFQEDSCTFTEELTSWMFLHLPVCVMLVLNCLLYLFTRYNLGRLIQTFGGGNRAHDTASQGLRLHSKVLRMVLLCGACLLLLTTPFSRQCVFFHYYIGLLFYCQGSLLFLLIFCDGTVLRPFYARCLEAHIGYQKRKQMKKEKKLQKERNEYEKYQLKLKEKEKKKNGQDEETKEI